MLLRLRALMPFHPCLSVYIIQKGQGSIVDVDGRDELVFTFPEDIFVYKAER